MDENNGDNPWQDAIAKEMKIVKEKFKIISEGGNPSPGYQKIRCHIIFDINMEDFRRKARFVAGVHVTNPPDTMMYASVVSR